MTSINENTQRTPATFTQNVPTDFMHETQTKAGTNIKGRQSIAVEAGRYTRAIPSNLVLLDNTRIRESMRRFQRYKLHSFKVIWQPTISVSNSGGVIGGSLPTGAQLSEPATSLPITSGGFRTAIFRGGSGSVDTAAYFDRWRSVFDATAAEGNPFTYYLHTPANDLRVDGFIMVEYDMTLKLPIAPGNGTPPIAKQVELAVTDVSVGQAIMPSVSGADAEVSRLQLLVDLGNVFLGDRIGDYTSSLPLNDYIPAGAVIEVVKAVSGSTIHKLLKYGSKWIMGDIAATLVSGLIIDKDFSA